MPYHFSYAALKPKDASSAIRLMYDAINRRDVVAAIAHIDDDCIYQDFNFARPFTGRAAVQELFEEACQNVPDTLLFVIDDITTGDADAVGVLWHVELDGIPFPNGRGVSFYRMSANTGKVIFARDVVEPAIKPGKIAFSIIRLASLHRWFAGYSNLKPHLLPMMHPETAASTVSRWLWGMTAVYVVLLLLSPPGWLPGEPVWAIRAETLQEIGAESLNFFFVLPLLNQLGFSGLMAPTVHPAMEAFFNLAEAWIFMFLPLLLLDPRGGRLPRRLIWGMAMFLTNVFLMPYMALRLAQPVQLVGQKGWLARIFGSIGLGVSAIAIAWFGFARPEFGGLSERLVYLAHQAVTSRVTLAFCVDLALFWLFQVILMGAVMPPEQRWLRFIPFWGLALWLVI